jgi:hypothetical protein
MSNANTDELDPTPGAVRIDLHFDCTKETLWETITDPERLSAWLGGPCRIEPHVGGEVRFDLRGDGVDASGVVRSADPIAGMRVAMLRHTFVDARDPDVVSECAWAVIDAESPAGSGCDLHFTHDGFGELGPVGFASQWGTRLEAGVGATRIVRQATTDEHAASCLRDAKTVLLVSFIGPEVPNALLAAGFEVIAKTGPGVEDWARGPGTRTRPPEPHDNRGCWVPAAQSEKQRRATEARGIRYIDDHYLPDVVRRLGQ